MKEIRGNAEATVGAPAADCYALLAAVDRYPSWDSDLFREVEVLSRDAAGRVERAAVVLRLRQGPIGRDLELVVAVRGDPPDLVQITRLPNEPTDPERLTLTWRLQAGARTRIELDFEASVSSLPAFVPLPRVGDQLARSVMDAAVGALEDRAPHR